MRQIFQTVVVMSLTLGAPCIIFAQGGDAPVSMPAPAPSGSAPLGAPRTAPLIPYAPQTVSGQYVSTQGGWRHGRHRMYAEKQPFPMPCDGAPPLPPQNAAQDKGKELPPPPQPEELRPQHGMRHGGKGRGDEDCTAPLRDWLAQMTPEEQMRARDIMKEAAPRLRDLKDRLRAKMRELQALTYGKETDPQALPELGQELQQLRRQLGQEFTRMNHRLVEAVGRPLPPPPGRGFRSLSSVVPE